MRRGLNRVTLRRASASLTIIVAALAIAACGGASDAGNDVTADSLPMETTVAPPPVPEAPDPAVTAAPPTAPATAPAAAPAATTPPSPPGPQLTPCPSPIPPRAIPPGVTVTVELPKLVFARDEPVPITVRVRNTGSERAARERPRDSLDVEYFVKSGDATIWRWSAGDEFRGIHERIWYEPGEEVAHTEAWPDDGCDGERKVMLRHRPGWYTAGGFVVDRDGAWYAQEVQFEIR